MLDTAPPLALVADGGASVVPGWHAAAVDLNRDTVLNANTIPQFGTEPITPVRVRALLFWRVAGEQWITGTAVATSPRLLLVEPDEPIDRDYPLWLPPEDLHALDIEPAPTDDGPT